MIDSFNYMLDYIDSLPKDTCWVILVFMLTIVALTGALKPSSNNKQDKNK